MLFSKTGKSKRGKWKNSRGKVKGGGLVGTAVHVPTWDASEKSKPKKKIYTNGEKNTNY